MSNDGIITIDVGVLPWTKSADNSFLLLTEKVNGSWVNSSKKWFPKKLCTLNEESGTLTLPTWLHKKIMK